MDQYWQVPSEIYSGYALLRALIQVDCSLRYRCESHQGNLTERRWSPGNSFEHKLLRIGEIYSLHEQNI